MCKIIIYRVRMIPLEDLNRLRQPEHRNLHHAKNEYPLEKLKGKTTRKRFPKNKKRAYNKSKNNNK